MNQFKDSNNVKAGLFNSCHPVPTELTSIDTLSIFSRYGALAEVTYAVSNVGDIGVKYYLKRIPGGNFRKLVWSPYRHEMGVFMARDYKAAEARLKIFQEILESDKATKTPFASFAEIKDAKISGVQIQVVMFTENIIGTMTL